MSRYSIGQQVINPLRRVFFMLLELTGYDYQEPGALDHSNSAHTKAIATRVTLSRNATNNSRRATAFCSRQKSWGAVVASSNCASRCRRSRIGCIIVVVPAAVA